MYDSIIIGKGPAGISTAIYISRSNLKCLVIGNDITALKNAKKIENYYGFEEPISGEELFKKGIEQAKKQGIEVKNEEVLDIEYGNDSYIVKTVSNTYKAKTIVLATGKSRKNANIIGEEEFIGKGISYCAICDGFFFKNKNIAVIGNGDYALHEARILHNVSNNVTIFTNGKPLSKTSNIEIKNVIEGRIDRIRGEKRVENILLEDKRSIPVDGIFIAQGTASSIDFAKKLGIIINNNNIIVNENMETNVPGVYAAGDCTGGLLQISKAVYEGAKCGLSIAKKLKNI